MKKIKIITLMAALALGISAVTQADILVDFGLNNNWITNNYNLAGLTGTTPNKYVPFSMTTPRTTNSMGYTGPAIYGGAGNYRANPSSDMSWTFANGTPDYPNAGISSNATFAIGDKVWAVYMFTNTAATITQVVYDIRLSGGGATQTNTVRIVVRKTDGSFYISEDKSRLSTGYFTNSNPSALAWYNYDPATSLTNIGTAVAGFQLDNVDAVGEMVLSTYIGGATTSIGAGTRTFQAWGSTVALKNILATPDSLNITEGTTNSFQVRLSTLPDNSVTVNVSRASGSANLAVRPDPTTFVFDATNWSIWQSVYVEALSDVDTNNAVATIACVDAGGIYSTKNVQATQIDTNTVAPSALFSATPLMGYAPLLVSFTDTSTGTITNRYWDFGDGAVTNTTLTAVSHTYTSVGTNTVSLIASGPDGASTNTKTSLVVVVPGAPASLPFYGPFNDAVSSNGIPSGWFVDDTNRVNWHSSIVAGSLTYSGLAASQGNSFGLGTKTADYYMDFASPNLATNQTVYFSTLLRINSATPSNMISGAIRLFDGADLYGSGVEIGFGVTNAGGNLSFSLDNRNNPWNSAIIKTPASYIATNATYLLVGSYTRGTSATHVADASGAVKLWINPDSATFGTATPPVATLTTNSYVSDSTWSRLQIISAGTGSWPTNWQIDEVRISTNWAEVVPSSAAPPAPVITSVLLATGTVNQAFSYQITADNSPASFNATGLPAGLNVDTNSGAITGTPTVAGSNDVTISASNAGGTDSKTLVLVISPVVTDSNGNGIPDSWEIQYFGVVTNIDPNALAANGINTYMQTYVAGLNPTNPASVFRAAGTPPRVLSWNTVSGRVYSVYWTTNLMSGFQCIASNVPWTQNNLTNAAPPPSSYYKVDVRLE